MKLLYWKEWRELRTLPVVAALTYIAFMLVAATISTLTHSNVQWSNVSALLILTWFIFAFSSGAGTISQEVGNGTLDFVSVMPISRMRFWWIKISSALTAFIAAVLLTSLVWYIVSAICFSGDLGDALHLISSLTYFDPMRLQITLITLAVLFGLVCSFAAGVCASPFFDRPIAATVAALIGGIFYVSFVTKEYTRFGVFKTVDSHSGNTEYSTLGLSTGDFWSMLAVAALLTFIALLPLAVTSFYTTKFGESLKSTRRFVVGSAAAVGSSLLSTALFAFGHLCKLW